MKAIEKLIGNLCYHEKRVFNYDRDDLLVSVLGKITVEQFALYLEHFVEAKIREIEDNREKQIDRINDNIHNLFQKGNSNA